MATPALPKITVFWNKGYGVINSNLFVGVFLWRQFGNSSISMKKSSEPQFYKDLTRKTTFIEWWYGFKFNNLGLTLGTNLKFYTSVAKELKIKVNIFWANSYFCRSYKEKPNSGCLFHPILNSVKYDLLLLRFSWTDSALFLSQLLSY